MKLRTVVRAIFWLALATLAWTGLAAVENESPTWPIHVAAAAVVLVPVSIALGRRALPPARGDLS